MISEDTSLLIISDDDGLSQEIKRSADFPGTVRQVTGAAALPYMHLHAADLVLLDLNLAFADGFEFCAAIRCEHPGLPILVITDGMDPASETRALALGADDCLAKPLNPALLSHRIRLHQERQRMHRSLAAPQQPAKHRYNEREAVYRAILNQAADAIVLFDALTLEIVEFNDAACLQTGYSRDELSRMRLTDLQADYPAERIRSHICEAAIPRTPLDFETRHRCKNGEWRDILHSNRFIELNNTTYVTAIWHDITQRKRTADRMNLLSQAVEQSQNSIIITDPEGRIEYINSAFTKNTGYTLSEAIGVKAGFNKSGENDPSLYQALWATLKAGKSWKGQFTNLHKNGEHVIEFAHITPIRQNDGQITHYLSIQEDITEKKRLGNELTQYRRRLEELVDERTRQLEAANQKIMQDALEITDLYQNAPCGYHSIKPDGTFVDINDTELDMLGYRREEVLGRNIVEFIVTSPPNSLMDGLCTLEPSAKGYEAECAFRRKDGSVFPALVNATTQRDQTGQLILLRASLIDISERKARESEIAQLNDTLLQTMKQARDVAEAANRSKSVFLANMSHEIRTPMNAIVGLTQLLARSSPTPSQSSKIQKITRAADHLLGLINDILDFSKIEAGKLSLDNHDFDLDKIVDSVRAIAYERIKAKNLQFKISTAGIPRWLHGDGTRLGQILINLVSNAIKFTEQGKITVKGQVIHEDDQGISVRFAVRDSGIGIPPDQIDRLFRVFEQADSSTTRKYGGSGLGLAISQRLAKLMGGEIGAESHPGVGSTFWFTCRLTYANAPEETTPAPQTQGLHGVHVLLAEDNPINQEVVEHLLAEEGLIVDLADNGLRAVELAKENDYDIVLMDMQMPEMDGLIATENLRKMPRHADTPIIALTANAYLEDRVLCLNAGMNDHLAKPINADILLETIRKWLPNWRETDPAKTVMLPEESLNDRLAKIPGLDMETGLKSMRGHVERYARMLHKFPEIHDPDIIRMQDALNSGNLDGLRKIAHSIKGSANLLGLNQVGQAATKLDMAIRTGEHHTRIHALVAHFNQTYAEQCKAIQQLGLD